MLKHHVFYSTVSQNTLQDEVGYENETRPNGMFCHQLWYRRLCGLVHVLHIVLTRTLTKVQERDVSVHEDLARLCADEGYKRASLVPT